MRRSQFAALIMAAGFALAMGSLTALAGDYDPVPQPDVTVTVAPPTQPAGSPTEPSGNATQPPGGGGGGLDPGVPLAGTATSTPVSGTATPSGTAGPSGTATPSGSAAKNSLAGAGGAGTGDNDSSQSGVTTGVSALPSAGAGPREDGNPLFAIGAVLLLTGLGLSLRGARSRTNQ